MRHWPSANPWDEPRGGQPITAWKSYCLVRTEDVVDHFYNQLSPFYHLIYDDWEASIALQSEQLRDVIQSEWGGCVQTVLDVSCGIGTQSIGLARLGFQVTGSDLAPGAVSRAKDEASARALPISFSVCDMREAHSHHGNGFDVVLSADNSVPHLLNDQEILKALRAMHDCLRPGGGCIVTVRDYDIEQRGKGIVKPYGIREANGKRFLIWQVWDFEGEQYDLSMYFVEDDKESDLAKTHVMRARYYAISTGRLRELMAQAGFGEVKVLHGAFFQPVLVGTKQPV